MMFTSKQKIAVPDDLSSPQTKLVYVTLLAIEEATATKLQEILGLPKLTLLPILTSLVQNDYIQHTGGSYVSR